MFVNKAGHVTRLSICVHTATATHRQHTLGDAQLATICDPGFHDKHVIIKLRLGTPQRLRRHHPQNPHHVTNSTQMRAHRGTYKVLRADCIVTALQAQLHLPQWIAAVHVNDAVPLPCYIVDVDAVAEIHTDGGTIRHACASQASAGGIQFCPLCHLGSVRCVTVGLLDEHFL